MIMTDEGPIGRYRLHRNDNMLGERGKNLRAEGYDVESPENWHLIWSFEHLEHAALKMAKESLKSGAYSVWKLVDGEPEKATA